MSNFNVKKILILGSNGMLGQRLTNYFFNNPLFEVFCASNEDESVIKETLYKQIDITNKEELELLISNFLPHYIINAAAYTNVDKSELEKALVWNINVAGLENISIAANKINAHVIHISSDYVFDGVNGPYTEKNITNPIGYYGITKLEGEKVLITSGAKNTIIRTNVLYGPAKYGRPDYVKWVYNELKAGKAIRIVKDQINNPTYIDDIVQAINKIIELNIEGLFNIGGAEFLNRFDFTLRIADYFNLDKSLIEPILTKQLNQIAKRPLSSGLITEKAKIKFGFEATRIEETFKLMKEELNM
ncbi:MAG: SDR family oxidoreductase [bacterium]